MANNISLAGRALALLVGCSSTLAACGRPAEPTDAGAAPPPAPAVRVSDFSQPMIARGTEPFWALQMDGLVFTLKRPDQPDARFQAPGADIQPGRATWVARATDGRQLTATLIVGDCSDGMSDHTYPMSAEVVLRDEVLRGCAAKTAELPQSGG